MLTYRLPTFEQLYEEEIASATGFTLDEGGRLPLTDGGFIEPRTFTRKSQSGVPLQHYGHPATSALADHLYVMGVHFVRDGRLVEATIEIGGPFGKRTTHLREELVHLEGVRLDLDAASRRADDPQLSRHEVDALARGAIHGIDHITSEHRAMEAARWVDLLGKLAPRSDTATARLVAALADDGWFDTGSSPYDSYPESVSEHAVQGLYGEARRAHALPHLLALLARIEDLPETEKPSAITRANIVKVVSWFGRDAAPATPILERLKTASDVTLRCAAETALDSIGGLAATVTERR